MIELEIDFEHILEEYDDKVKKMVVYYRQPLMMGGGRKLYKNRIRAVGKDIDKIREVKYIFHASFPNPIRTVIDRDTNFEQIFWAWGNFTMNIVVADTDGDLHNYRHPIRLLDKVKKAEALNLTKEYKPEQISPR